MSIRKVYLELTNKCNLECIICYRKSWDEKSMDMSAELYQKIKREITKMDSVKSVVLGGIGEPTCAPVINEALEDFGSYFLTLTTNAVVINQTLLDSIVRNTDMIMVSIDGLHDNYFKIRGTSLDKILYNIKRISESKKTLVGKAPRIGIQYVIYRDNIEDIFQLIDLANSYNAHVLVLSNLLPQTRENADKILYTRYENKEMKLLYKKIVSYSNRKGVNIQIPNFELKTERRCSFIDDDAVFVSAGGDVTPCYRLSHCYREYVFGREKTVLKHSFGNVNDKSLKDIWESKEYKSFRVMVDNNRYPSCMDCDLAEGCDLVRDTSSDCYAASPSCADCLWSRKFTLCP